MPDEKNGLQSISSTEAIELIHRHPCFSQLTIEEVKYLAALLVTEYIPPGKTIVTEGELVDCIYFIAQGKAEVSHEVTKEDGSKESIPVAILDQGEAIGLNEAGFFSTTGKRTATVVAQSEMMLLRLNLSTFHQFAAANPHINELMRNSANVLRRISLIKQAAPFAKLSIDDLHTLIEQETIVSFPANHIIFKKGDPGDYCYLIEQGEVEIFMPHSDGSETSIAILTSSMIFGEAALLLNLPRNASVRALQDCELLAISHKKLEQTIKKEKNVANALMTLMKNRIRPIQFPYIETHIQKSSDQETVIILKDPQHWNYYQLSREEWFIWQLLDGNHSLHDITLAFNHEFKIFDPDAIATFIMDLDYCGFIEKCIPYSSEDEHRQSRFLNIIVKIRRLMEASVSYGNVDPWLTKTYQKGIWLLFTYPVQILFGIITITGLIAYIYKFHYYIDLFRVTSHSHWLILISLTVCMACAIPHELAHAYTTKAFGRQISCFGIGWFWLGPIAFCDTSDMWLCRRWQRFVVDAAGLYVDLFLAGLASLIALTVTHPLVILFLWLFALWQYLAIFANLSPDIELDGYYILLDFTNKDNLRESAIVWLMNDFPKSWNKPALLWQHRAEMFYWLISIIYLLLALIIPYYVMKYLLYGLFGIRNPFLSILLPVLVLILSSISIWGEFKQKRRLKLL